MKKKFLFVPVALALMTLVSSARILPGAAPAAKQAFEKQFSGALFVNWEEAVNGSQRVTFVWGGHRTQAWFSEDGEMLASIRGIFFQQMPMAVIRSVEKRFGNAIVLEVNEAFNAEGTNYYLTMEIKDKRYKVRMDADGIVQSKDRLQK